MIASDPVLLTDQIISIENRTEKLLRDVFGTASPPIPVDLNQVATRLGLTIKQGPFKNPEVVGFYDRSANTIYISEKDPYYRQAFTLAHEIGHSILHDDIPQETFFRHSEMALAGEGKEQEQEANWFAASLLMPRDLVEGYWQAFPNDIPALASIFKVSPTAMHNRVKNLGLTRD